MIVLGIGICIFGLLVVLGVYSCCVASGMAAQCAEDEMGIRRS